jgi:sulfite exporter TauE/SafE
MGQDLSLLLISAASIGFIHTLIGPDHYLPFIVMSKSGQWSLRKTTVVTILCGIGHVLGSVVLGFVGIAFGLALAGLEAFEAVRGDIAAWALIAFGLVYAAWGLRQAWRNQPHAHSHSHSNGLIHTHSHNHQHEHTHTHGKVNTMTPWVLFTIFVLGPCEPLIPLLMYPAAQSSFSGLLAVTATFGVVTIATMLAVVLASVRGLDMLPVSSMQRYAHALAGTAIFASGLAIQFLGL